MPQEFEIGPEQPSGSVEQNVGSDLGFGNVRLVRRLIRSVIAEGTAFRAKSDSG